jgi:hypothetical protein
MTRSINTISVPGTHGFQKAIAPVWRKLRRQTVPSMCLTMALDPESMFFVTSGRNLELGLNFKTVLRAAGLGRAAGQANHNARVLLISRSPAPAVTRRCEQLHMPCRFELGDCGRRLLEAARSWWQERRWGSGNLLCHHSYFHLSSPFSHRSTSAFAKRQPRTLNVNPGYS